MSERRTSYEETSDAEEPSQRSLSGSSPLKSKASLRRKRSQVAGGGGGGGGPGESAAKSAESRVEPIAVTVGGLDRLRDGYWSDLRELLPPSSHPEEGCVTVNGMLRRMLDAADEIDRALRPPLTLLLRLDRADRRPRSDGGPSRRGPSENVCELPFKGRRRKPDDDTSAAFRMKTYRVLQAIRDDDDDDWTAATAAVELNGSATSSSSGLRVDLVSQQPRE